MEVDKQQETHLLSLVNKEKLTKILETLLDENEFLSEFGIRALSKYHKQNPYSIAIDGTEYDIAYDPGDSTSGMFGGNSNWRGPIWLPINYLLIKAIKNYGAFYADDLKVACPTGSTHFLNLEAISQELSKRLFSIFKKDSDQKRPVHGAYSWFYEQPENKDLVLFLAYCL